MTNKQAIDFFMDLPKGLTLIEFKAAVNAAFPDELEESAIESLYEDVIK